MDYGGIDASAKHVATNVDSSFVCSWELPEWHSDRGSWSLVFEPGWSPILNVIVTQNKIIRWCDKLGSLWGALTLPKLAKIRSTNYITSIVCGELYTVCLKLFKIKKTHKWAMHHELFDCFKLCVNQLMSGKLKSPTINTLGSSTLLYQFMISSMFMVKKTWYRLHISLKGDFSIEFTDIGQGLEMLTRLRPLCPYHQVCHICLVK